MNSSCGIVPCASRPTPRRKAFERSPTSGDAGAKARSSRASAQATPTKPSADEAHHHRVERVLRAHQPAVEERERGRHQQHERGRDEHERHVGRNDHRCLQGRTSCAGAGCDERAQAASVSLAAGLARRAGRKATMPINASREPRGVAYPVRRLVSAGDPTEMSGPEFRKRPDGTRRGRSAPI